MNHCFTLISIKLNSMDVNSIFDSVYFPTGALMEAAFNEILPEVHLM